MRAVDIHQAIEVCRVAADEMLVVAAQQDASLSPAERRHLAGIAAAVLAHIEPDQQRGAEASAEPAEPDPV